MDNRELDMIPAQGNATLTDDDELQDGAEVPIPDPFELYPAMEKAFVTVQLDLDPAFNDDDVPFALNSSVDVQDLFNSFQWDSRSHNGIAYWVAYVLGGFQGPATGQYADLDPDSEDGPLGVTHPTSGGSLIFLETVRDRAVRDGLDPMLKEQDTFVHEVGHNFFNLHPVTKFEVDGVTYSRYTDIALKRIRTSDKPKS